MTGAGRSLVAVLLLLAPSRAGAQSAFFAPPVATGITVRTDLRRLLRDVDPDTNIWRDGTFAFAGSAGPDTVPVRLRTRGLYRLRTCSFKPLRLRFSQDSVRGTPLDSLRRPKLVTHCENSDEYEQNLLQEYAIYRVYRLFTPAGYSARLVRATYEDAAGSMRPVTRYAFITEDPERLAERLGGTMLASGEPFARVEPGSAALVSVFQYFIANTDWSVPALHNIELVRTPQGLLAVPYDFDWAGVIDARYARPDPQLRIRSVRERIWRGRCPPLGALEPVLARFEALRDSIAQIYREVPGLDPRNVERTLRYHDEFYRAIADRPRFMRRVVEPDCRQ